MKDYRKEVDLLWLSSGDFALDENTLDIRDTSKLKLQTLVQKLDTIVRSSRGEWATAPQLGGNLGAMVGQPNSALTGQAVERALYSALSAPDVLSPSEFELKVFPASKTQIAIILSVKPSNIEHKITLVYSYDTNSNRLTPRNR